MMTSTSSHGRPDEQALVAAIAQLTDHVRALIVALDECLVELQWRNDQRSDSLTDVPFVLTSMPLDPASEYWRINELSAADLPAMSRKARPRTLFD